MTDPDYENGIRSRVAGFLHGLSGGDVEPTYSLPDPGVGSNELENEMEQYASMDMVRATERVDESGPNADGEAEPLRVLSGGLDFLGMVGQEAFAEAERIFEEVTDSSDTNTRKRDKTFVFHQLPLASPNWKGTRYTVDKQLQVARKNANRRLLRFVNFGTEPVILRAETESSLSVSPNGWTVPVSKADGSGPYTAIEIPTTDEVWAYPTTAGTANTLEVMELWGEPSENQVP
jgi:hypothetical protein